MFGISWLKPKTTVEGEKTRDRLKAVREEIQRQTESLERAIQEKTLKEANK